MARPAHLSRRRREPKTDRSTAPYAHNSRSQQRKGDYVYSDGNPDPIDDYIICLKCNNASLQQQLAAEAKPHIKLTNYRDRSRQYTLGKSIILTKYADTISTFINC